MTCRDCKLYDVDKVKDKAGRVRSKYVTKCLWVSTEPYPLSLRLHHHIRDERPVPSFMAPNDGEGCPCFIKRET